MQTMILVALLAAGICAAGLPKEKRSDWAPAPSPLRTRWAADVSPQNARPEYPRPQAVRKAWKSLNGLWEFAFDDKNIGRSQGWNSGRTLPDRILVPWTFEASLSGIGKGSEVHERVWYRRTFTLRPGWKGKRILLHLGAVDWESTVWVNGKEMGTHRGGYAPFEFDITESVKGSGPQEVVVAVYDPDDPKKGAFQPKGKQLGSHSIWYTRTTGIWQSVWLEPLDPTHIAGFNITTDMAGKLSVAARIAGSGPASLTVNVSKSGRRSASATISSTGDLNKPRVVMQVQDPLVWSPESPALYDVTLTLRQGAKVTDQVKTYCAFRSVGMADGRITLNGKPYFLRGVLDQGFWPDGIYTPPTDGAIKSEVLTTKAFGFNLARKHVKVEDPRWYYYCDKLGLLVAQDMPSSHNLQPAGAKESFLQEWGEIIHTLKNHPAIIIWVPFNENWGDPKEFQDRVVDFTHAADASRPVIDASGWTQRDKTDITDIHDYGNDLRKHCMTSPPRPRWIGEYGGVALPVEGHTWITGWGYQTVKTPDELVAKYKFLTDQINNGHGLSGFVYTQLTDVEQELNGVMTYDRQPKALPGMFAAVNVGMKDRRK